MRILRVKVKPNSKQQSIQMAEDGSLVITLKSPPMEGKANEELIKLLAKELNVTKSKIQIRSGLSSRQKLIEIED